MIAMILIRLTRAAASAWSNLRQVPFKGIMHELLVVLEIWLFLQHAGGFVHHLDLIVGAHKLVVITRFEKNLHVGFSLPADLEHLAPEGNIVLVASAVDHGELAAVAPLVPPVPLVTLVSAVARGGGEKAAGDGAGCSAGATDARPTGAIDVLILRVLILSMPLWMRCAVTSSARGASSIAAAMLAAFSV